METRVRATMIGVVLVLTTPFTGLATWAGVATLIGESQLEGPDGQTLLGLLVLVAPALLGLALIAAGMSTGYSVRLGDVALIVGASGLAMLVLGVWSLLRVDGANIGGPLLVLAGLTLATVSTALVLSLRRSTHR